MHALSGYLEFPADRRDETLVALREVCERSRQDPGCIDYWWAEDVERPDRFRFFECWATVEDFAAHQASPTRSPSWRSTSPGSRVRRARLDIGGRRPCWRAEP